jgi:hypothetical protein
MSSTAILFGTQTCINSFDTLSRVIGSATEKDPSSLLTAILKDHNGRFRIWCGNMGAHQNGKTSLDYRLRNSERVSQGVERLLRYLNGLLTKGTSIDFPNRQWNGSNLLSLSHRVSTCRDPLILIMFLLPFDSTSSQYLLS